MEGVIRKSERLQSRMSTRGPLSNDSGENDRGTTTVMEFVNMQTTRGCVRCEAQEQLLLLPRILDEITLDKIVPRLPWKTFHSLSLVSRGWEQAIRNRVVYDARVGSQSRETLVLINQVPTGHCCGAIGLYSIRDGSFYQLPIISNQAMGIPHSPQPMGIPYSSQCISLDGKIYVLGGRTDVMNVYRTNKNKLEDLSITNKMYVLDLAGQRKWKQCAPMIYARRNFGCGILDGRIYVCGGFASDGPVLVPEVYDPNLDSWFPIKSMISMRVNHRVIAVEHELLVYGGNIIDREFESIDSTFRYPNACFFEIYNPARDDWRKAESSLEYKEVVFMTEGKLHSMDKGEIHVHDTVTNSWIKKHSLPRIEYCFGLIAWVTALVVDNELVTILKLYIASERIQVIGLSTKERRMKWHCPECSFPMCSSALSAYAVPD